MFLLSCSAIIEHTNKVLYMEDDDIAVVRGGKLSIHRMNRQAGEDPVRAIQTLQMELQQIMKGQMIVDDGLSVQLQLFLQISLGYTV